MATLLLNRHQLNRDAGTPTISVLAGEEQRACAIWSRWLKANGRAMVAVQDANIARVVAAYLDHLDRERDLVQDAARFLAGHLSVDPSELCGRLIRQGGAERWVFLTHVVWQGNGGLALCEALIGREGQLHKCPLSDCVAQTMESVAALVKWIPHAELPGLILGKASSSDKATVWLSQAAGSALALAAAAPAVPLALTANAAAFDAYLSAAPESRIKAVVRAGLIRIAQRAVPPAGVPPAVEGGSVSVCCGHRAARRQLKQQGASARLLRLFDEAAAGALLVPTEDTTDEQARSAAERFLFERLEELPVTRGLFALNAQLPFRFGPRPAEVDMVSATLHLAIEVDGYYHFCDAQTFRRDRRKDVLLQQQGFLVLRFLAEDVVWQLDDVVKEILEAVAFARCSRARRSHARRSRSSTSNESGSSKPS